MSEVKKGVLTWKNLTVVLRTMVTGTLGAVILVGVIGVVPLKRVSYTVKVPYQAIETYIEQEPYNGIEFYTAQVPYMATEAHTEVLNKQSILYDRDTFGVNPGYYVNYNVYIDVISKTKSVVTGDAQSLGGGEFALYVFDQKNFNAWKNNQDYQSYVASGKVTSYNFSFVPDHTDHYYFVFSNTFSPVANKQIQFSAKWDWQETQTGQRETTKYREETKLREVTKYRDVTKQKLVWKERPETRYKRVSVLSYLLRY